MFRYGVIALVIIFLSGILPAEAGDKTVNIGLIYTTKQAENHRNGTDDLENYTKAVEKNGGTILPLFQDDDDETLEGKLAGMKGLLIPGGGNIDPKFYGYQPLAGVEIEDPNFDEFCFRVLAYARDNNLPVLGICRGHQFMNVFFGGTLYQNIPVQYRNRVKVRHRNLDENKKVVSSDHMINISEFSPMHSMFLYEKRIMVNSTHQQAIKKLAPGFDISARSDDMLIEAIMSTGKTFMMGVQFHPERLLERDGRFNILFRKLVNEARKK
jgi:putative glutamine amidotransferase